MILNFIKSILAGFAQIAFNSNIIAGILMIIATWLASPVQAVSGVLAVMIATLTAKFYRVPQEQVREGIYGFNAALVGIALPIVVFPGESISWMLLSFSAIGGCASVFLTAILRSVFAKWNLPALSLSYCIIISVFSFLHSIMTAGTSTERMMSEEVWSIREIFAASLSGMAQVLWVAAPVSGIIFLAAVCLVSRKDAAATVIGTMVGTFAAILIGLPKDTVMSGIYGYNAVLLMLVLMHEFGYSMRCYLGAIIAAGATTMLTAGMDIVLKMVGIRTVSAFPYVIIGIGILIVRNKFADKFKEEVL